MTLQAETGEYRPGIPRFWSSYPVLSMVMDLDGPFGPRGLLGFRLGPIGDTPLNPWFWWQKAIRAGVWGLAPRDLFEFAGPLNPNTGIFSAIGPDASDWMQGDFSALGTNSFAGSKGPLGPLGPMGALLAMRNMILDTTGFYVDQNTHKLVREISIPFGQDDRIYEISQKLSQKFSQELSDRYLLGTNYSVDGHLNKTKKSVSFQSTAQASELVSAIVIPDIGFTSTGENQFLPKRLNFSLRVVSESGAEIVLSQLRNKENIVQFQVRQGERFAIQLLSQGMSYWNENQNFRLIVTPASSYYSSFLWTRILGPEFENLWKSNGEYSELALTFIWIHFTRDCFRDYKLNIRSGKVPKNTIVFWKQVMSEAIQSYHEVTKASDDEKELRESLIRSAQSALNDFRRMITVDPMTGSEILKMWRDLYSTSPIDQRNFNLTEAQAEQIPFDWLSWMEQKLLHFVTART